MTVFVTRILAHADVFTYTVSVNVLQLVTTAGNQTEGDVVRMFNEYYSLN